MKDQQNDISKIFKDLLEQGPHPVLLVSPSDYEKILEMVSNMEEK